jgi:TonB family protein
MDARTAIMITAVLATAPAFGETPQAAAARNTENWNILQKLYPARAIKAHEEGAVAFKVAIDKKGDVANCQVTHSSGHPLLDAETCKIITLNAQFKPEPGLGDSQTRTREGVITWKLPNSTALLQAPRAVAAVDAPDPVICKKVLKTGTLAGYERTCMTQSDWNLQSDQGNEMWGDVQGKKGSSHGG